MSKIIRIDLDMIFYITKLKVLKTIKFSNEFQEKLIR